MIKQDVVIFERVAGVDDKLSENFLLSEMQCKCTRLDCTYTLVSPRLVNAFQTLRNFNRMPLKINSGFRCKEHNLDVGGVQKSKHTMGLAIDIDISEFTEAYKKEFVFFASTLFDYTKHYEEHNFIHCHVEKSRNYI